MEVKEKRRWDQEGKWKPMRLDGAAAGGTGTGRLKGPLLIKMKHLFSDIMTLRSGGTAHVGDSRELRCGKVNPETKKRIFWLEVFDGGLKASRSVPSLMFLKTDCCRGAREH